MRPILLLPASIRRRPDYNSFMREPIRLQEIDMHQAALEAAGVLAAGGVAVVPTDTVYGLAARPDLPGAVRQVFSIKGRDAEKALVIMVARLGQALELVEVEEREGLSRLGRLWPGPLTVVVPHAGLDWMPGITPSAAVGIRIPGCPFMLELLSLTGPLAVTSANTSGAGAPASFRDIDPLFLEKLPPSALLIDSGQAGSGQASTVVEITNGRLRILRPGEISEDRLKRSWNAAGGRSPEAG